MKTCTIDSLQNFDPKSIFNLANTKILRTFGAFDLLEKFESFTIQNYVSWVKVLFVHFSRSETDHSNQ